MNTGGNALLLRERVATILEAHKHGILKIDRDGRIFDITLALHPLDDLLACEHPLTLQDPFDDITHDTRLIAPFFECVETAPNKYETCVLDKFVVCRCGVRLAGKKLLNAFSHFSEMHRGAVALECKVRKIAGILDADVGRFYPPPLAKRISPDTLRNDEPASDDVV